MPWSHGFPGFSSGTMLACLYVTCSSSEVSELRVSIIAPRFTWLLVYTMQYSSERSEVRANILAHRNVSSRRRARGTGFV